MKKSIQFLSATYIFLLLTSASLAQCPNCDDGNPCTFDLCVVDTIPGGGNTYRCTHTGSCTITTWYLDADGDKYYSTTTLAAIFPGQGWSASPGLGSGDCDDNNAAVHPGAVEIANNGIDEDCSNGDLVTVSLSRSIINPTNCTFSNGSISISGLIPNNANYVLKYVHNNQIISIQFAADATGQYLMHDLAIGIYTDIDISVLGSHLLPKFTDTLFAKADPSWFAPVSTDFNLCEGMNMNLAFLGTQSPAGTIFTWSGPNGFVSVPKIDDPNFTLIDVKQLNAGTYTCVGWSPDFCTDTIVSHLIVSPPANLALSTGVGNICQSGDANALYAPGCSIISRQVPNLNDPNALSGVVNSCVFVDDNVTMIESGPYVPRHYDITPVLNASSATATITLYALQSEFDAYNAYVVAQNLNLPLMPTGSVDNGNVRVTQFHEDGSTAFIIPLVVWNASLNCWEITFSVTGFSSFYIHSGSIALPVKLLSFTGQLNKENCILTWQSSQENLLRFEIERSYDASHFEQIGWVKPGNEPGNKTYGYTDTHWNKTNDESIYYRLKMLDKDGKFTYSKIISLTNKMLPGISISPNPATRSITISGLSANGEITILSMDGKAIKKQRVNAPTTVIPVNLLPKGSYIVQYINGKNQHHQKLIIQ